MRVGLVNKAARCWFAPLMLDNPNRRKVEDALRSRGVLLNDRTPDDLRVGLDLILADVDRIAEVLAQDPELPIVAFSNYDAAQLHKVEEQCLADARVRLLLKPLVYSDPRTYKQPHFHNSLLDAYLGADVDLDWLRPIGIDAAKKNTPNVAYDPKRVVPFHLMPIILSGDWISRRAPDLKSRPIDVNLVGTGASYWSYPPRVHRERVYRWVRLLPPDVIRLLGMSQHPTRPRVRNPWWEGGLDFPSPGSYLETVRLSKVVASPYGYSEISARDYEAAALGSVVLKPPMGHVKTFPTFPYLTGLPTTDADFATETEDLLGTLSAVNEEVLGDDPEIYRRAWLAGEVEASIYDRLTANLRGVL